MNDKPHIKRALFKPRGYPHAEWTWVCSGSGIVESGCTVRHAYIGWALWHTIREAVGVAE